jgi:DNA-binding CsgD family transcriptional regulator/tetratricopeptide (TPR) repeat protein
MWRTNAHELYDRRDERRVLDRLVAGAKAGESGVLVLCGEAGVGKTALVDDLLRRTSGCRVVRATGAESEMELAFAGLHQLCMPMMERLDRLPDPQHDALATAFGLRAGNPPDRFLVGLAVLSMLSDAAADEPLICVVDDLQWMDRISAQTLAFVARRLFAERVAMVFAVRDVSSNQELAGLPKLVLEGLADGDARVLLESVVVGRLDERVRDRIVAETNGNPLALLELPRGLTAGQLAGGFGLPGAVPLTSRIEQNFLARLQVLPGRTQQLLLTAAADPTADVRLLLRAAEGLGIAPNAAVPAEDAGLVELGAQVRFRHPLVRSVLYRGASADQRRQAHQALADATDQEADPDRRAWHRAHAAVEPDESVADELERSANRAQRRGGVAAAAAFLEKATALTPDPARRVERALAAAQAQFKAGAPDAAYGLVRIAEIGPLDEFRRARLARLHGQMAFAERRGTDTVPMLFDAAKRLEPLDNGSAREAYLEALGAVIFAGRLGGRLDLRQAAEVLRAVQPGPKPPRLIDVLLDGMATRYTEGYVAGVPALRRVLEAFDEDAGRGQDEIMRWLSLACPLVLLIAVELWDYEAWHDLATRAVDLARDAGALTVLPVALAICAGVHVQAGEFAAASALIHEADAIEEATGNPILRYPSLMLAGWRGIDDQVLTLVDACVRDVTARGEGRALGQAWYVSAVLHNGRGRYEAALSAARQACEYEDLGTFQWSLPELVEAAARSGALDEASGALSRLAERTRAAGTDWALGIEARSRALLLDGPAADAAYREAIERLARSRVAVHLGRAHLVYGEWLRREQRRVEAREHLRVAHETLERIGAEAFAERARRELRATGETVRRRTVKTRVELTAQETQIARLAGGGLTNPEIGAQLFLSPHTIEWHLRKVFAKLDITSRRQLHARLVEVSLAGESA